MMPLVVLIVVIIGAVLNNPWVAIVGLTFGFILNHVMAHTIIDTMKNALEEVMEHDDKEKAK